MTPISTALNQQLGDVAVWLANSLGIPDEQFEVYEAATVFRNPGWGGSFHRAPSEAVTQLWVADDLDGRSTISVIAHELAHVRQSRAMGDFGYCSYASYAAYLNDWREVEARCVSVVVVAALFDEPLQDFNRIRLGRNPR